MLVPPAYGSPRARSSAGPFRAVRVLETGPSRGITGFTVLFNRRPSRASAKNIDNYTLQGARKNGKRVRIELAKARSEGRRVRLIAADPFGQAQFARLVIRVNGRRDGLRDRGGRLLDGNRDRRPGGNAVFRFRLISGTTVRFSESDGDRAELDLLDGGRIDGIAPIGGPTSQHTQFWILDPIALRSRLKGPVTTTTAAASRGSSSSGNGIVVISEISGVDRIILTDFRNNPSFRVSTLTTPNNATGIG
jgi:hypothetical protein